MNPVDRYTCAEAFRKLDDYVDRQLSAEETRLLEQHLAVCVRCATEYKFEQQMIDQIRQKLRHVELPEGLVGKILRGLQGQNGSGS